MGNAPSAAYKMSHKILHRHYYSFVWRATPDKSQTPQCAKTNGDESGGMEVYGKAGVNLRGSPRSLLLENRQDRRLNTTAFGLMTHEN